MSGAVQVSYGSTHFAYDDLAPDAAEIVRDAADCIRKVHGGFVQEIGRHLLRAKAVLAHGKFTAWAETELGINARTGRNYMQAASFLEGKAETVAVLPPTVLYALSAPTAPPEVVQAVVDAAAAGEALDAQTISTRLWSAKLADVELKAARQRSPGITREKLVASKAKQDRRWKAEQDREAERQAQAKQDAADRMRPLAVAILACPDDAAAKLLAVLSHQWADREALQALLEAGLRDGAI